MPEGDESLATLESNPSQEPHKKMLKSCLKKTKHNQAENVAKSTTPDTRQDKIDQDKENGRKNISKNGHIIRQRRKPKQQKGSKPLTTAIYELNAMSNSTDKPVYTLISEPTTDTLELRNPSGKLNFVNSKIGVDPDNAVDTVNLVDGGSSHTIVNIDTYYKIPNFSKGKTAVLKTDMRTASDTIKVSLKAKLQFTFVDIYGKIIQFYHTCLIVPNIKYDCYIENDILHSDKMFNVNLTHLLFKVNKPNEPLKIAPVKIDHKDPKEVMDVFSCHEIELFPFTTSSLTTVVGSRNAVPRGSETAVQRL
jgi:hypothetical protein